MSEIIDFRVTLPPREYADPTGDGDERFSDRELPRQLQPHLHA